MTVRQVAILEAPLALMADYASLKSALRSLRSFYLWRREIRICRMVIPSRLDEEGRSRRVQAPSLPAKRCNQRLA
jgi:hypothetical protein